MAGSVPDEDESVLELDDQLRRPLDTALKQQRIPGWHPILDPWWVVASLLILGAIFVPTGLRLKALSDDVVELQIQYDAYDDVNPICGINRTANANKTCELTFTAPRDMNPPILVHYQIENFYQNHRNYIKSRDNYQLLGSLSQDALSAEGCDPLNVLGNIRLNPCGLIANTLFNDVFTLSSGISSDGNESLVLLEQGIAWESDLKYAFAQPEGFEYEPCPDECDETCCDGDEWSCETPFVDTKNNDTCYRYFYPNDNTTQYLYETYPMVVSPIEGVMNEHFVVWMRVATLPTFRKLYGYFEQPIAAGTNFTFQINANFEVESFHGRKSLIVSTNNKFGGRNDILGVLFYALGFFCLGAGAFFGLKQYLRPRRVADKSYLHYKQA